jgi:hypothetical protein
MERQLENMNVSKDISIRLIGSIEPDNSVA